jgi:hypothetical protein
MSLSLLSRYAFFAVCVIFTLASLPFLEHDWLWPITAVTGVLSLIGIFDLLQSPHAVRRNYPILGNIRYLVEAIRPELLLISLTILTSPTHIPGTACRRPQR